MGKKVYQNDKEVVNEGFAPDKEALEILGAKIMAILIEDLPIKEKEPKGVNFKSKHPLSHITCITLLEII